MCDCMEFPKTIREFIDDYKFKDKEEVYTNGSELIQVFRVKQALEHYDYENRIAKLEKALDKACYNYILEKLNYAVSKNTCSKLANEEKQKLLKESEKDNA